MTSNRFRRTGRTVTILAGLAAAAALCTTTASADVTGLSVSDSNYAVGGNYTLTATCDQQQGTVNFTDNGQSLGSAADSGGTATLQWSPQTTGSHALVADGCVGAGQSDTAAQVGVSVAQTSGQGTGGGLIQMLENLLGSGAIQNLLSSLSAAAPQ
ncbi:hypothetical protein [Nocardia sp. NPDC051570]|uniref:hypothetical protein n=1 Tax=Nocardia sp. NPDC051570 TaxID=3364324 RepID=UPI00378BBEA7